MASKLRSLLHAARGGCLPDSPRLACQAANGARRAGAIIKQQWPGVKAKAEEAYQAWKSSVNAGDEFISLCYKTGKLIFWVAAPGMVMKIAFTEYQRNPEEVDENSRYEKTRAATLALMHHADPELAKAWDVVSSVFKTPDKVKEERRVALERYAAEKRRALEQATQEFADTLGQEHLRRTQEQVAKRLEKSRVGREEQASEGKQKTRGGDDMLAEVAVAGEENTAPGVVAWVRSYFSGKDKDAGGPSGVDSASPPAGGV